MPRAPVNKEKEWGHVRIRGNWHKRSSLSILIFIIVLCSDKWLLILILPTYVFCHLNFLKVQCTLMIKFDIMKRMLNGDGQQSHRKTNKQCGQSPLTSRKTRIFDLGNPSPGLRQPLFFFLFCRRGMMVRVVIYSPTIYHNLQQYFSYIVGVSYISGGNQSTLSKPQTYRKSLNYFIT